jgi:hypothetical protein
MGSSSAVVSIFLVLALAFTATPSAAFCLSHSHSHVANPACQATRTSTALAAGGLFGEGNPLSKIFGPKEEGPKVVVDIPATTVKIGPLRFLMQIHLVAEQNKPEPKSWLIKQGDESEIDIYFGDGTGMLSMDFSEYQIKITRYGANPSLKYQIQESVLLHNILDELTKVSFEVDDIEKEKRLLQLKNDNAIEDARRGLLTRAV